MTVLGLNVVGPPVMAAVIAASGAWWAGTTYCASLPSARPVTTDGYAAERGHHVVRFHSVDRTSECKRRGGVRDGEG